MIRMLATASVALALAGSSSALAHDIFFTGLLQGSQEVQPQPVQTNAYGYINGVLDVHTNTFSFQWVILGQLTGRPSAPGAHLHNAPAGSNGPVVFGFNNPDGTWALQGSATWTGMSNAHMAALLDGNIYANFHTSFYPAGELRGQLRQVPAPAAPALAFVAATLGLTRRRRGR